jgi:diguanylate cyclase (GGDEF)-like protein
MTYEITPLDTDITFLTLGYATRLLASETNLDNLVRISIDTLADFGRTKRVEFMSIAEDKRSAKVLGLMDGGVIKKPDKVVSLDGSHLEKTLDSKRPGNCVTPEGDHRLYMPLVGSENNAIGLVAIDSNKDAPLNELEMQILSILTTLMAISLENTRFYRLAMFDGLTGLYVRRQFDARLSEDMARVSRYGGELSIFLADIDHFKHVNDTYGHLQGDTVLQELSSILRNTIRKDVDIPCRYGGEELAVIMPNTGLDAAHAVAERFRQNCERYDFPGQEKPLKATVSCGVATIDSKTKVSMKELIQKADDMLYKAKESGRNRVLSPNLT